MSRDFKHDPFSREWVCAKYDDGDFVNEDSPFAWDECSLYDHLNYWGEDWEVTLYKVDVRAAPWKRVKNDPDDECGGVAETLIAEPKDGQSAQIQRLQSAVREMLESLNALEYSHYNTHSSLESYKPSTIETYGLTKEDMQ